MSYLSLLSDNFSYIVALTAAVLFAWMFVLNSRNNANTARITRCVAILEELSEDGSKGRQFFEQVRDVQALDERVKRICEEMTQEVVEQNLAHLTASVNAIKEHINNFEEERIAYIEDQINSIEEIVVSLKAQLSAPQNARQAAPQQQQQAETQQNAAPQMSEEDKVVQMHKSGRSVDEISRALGIGVNKVAMILRMRTNA